jgi:predicted dehydrogenase
VRVGLVGTGFAAAAHVEALRRVPGIEPAAVVGSSREKAAAFAQRLGIETAYGSLGELLADERIRAVHDCTPNHLHADVNHAVLDAGRHLLSEKPLGRTSAETRPLVRAACAAGVVTGVCFNYRHFPLVREARELLAGGEPGRIHFVHGAYLQDWLLLETDWNWRIAAGQGGEARALADIGSHWLDLVQHVTGDTVVETLADLTTIHPRRYAPAGGRETFVRGGDADGGETVAVDVDTEDFASVLLRFASGAKGAFSVSQVSAGRRNRLTFEIDAARAAIAWDQEEPNTLWVGRRDRPNAQVVRDPALLSPPAAALAHYPAGHQEGWPDALKNLFADFYAAVAAHDAGEAYEPSFASFEDAHRVTCQVESIVASNAAGTWAPVEAEVAA